MNNVGETSYKLKTNIRHRHLESEGIALRQDTAEIFVLNEVGSRIVDLISEGRSTEAIVSALLDEYDVDEVDLRRDVAEYLTQLFNEQLIAERYLQ